MAEGWFDPVIVGAASFPHTSASRRKVWDLTTVSQGWLRDLLWEHLAYEALRQMGRRPGATTISHRLADAHRDLSVSSPLRVR